MDNITFQLPAVRVKPDPPTVRKKESATEKATSPFNRLFDKTMSSQQSASVSDEEQIDTNLESDDQDSLISQGIANNLLLALVTVPPNVIPVNAQPTLNQTGTKTTKTQFVDTLLNNKSQDIGRTLSRELPQQASSDEQLSVMVNAPTQTSTDANLSIPASGKTVFGADGQALLLTKDIDTKQPDTNPATLSQTELQSKLDGVISTTVSPFSPVSSIPSETHHSSTTVTPQLSAEQTELPKLLPGDESVPVKQLKPDVASTTAQIQSQSPTLDSNELPLVNPPVTPPGKKEQISFKQPVETEHSTIVPVQAQSVLNNLSQGDKDFLSQSDSFPANNGLTELRAGKLDEPVFDTTQQVATPNQQDIIRQIVDRARLYLRPANQSEMVLQLRPEHLGELTLKVSVESGLVSATFHSDNPEVRQVIEASLPQLKQDLSQQGIKLDSVSVFSGSEQFFDNGQRSGQQQQSVPLRKNRRELLQAIESAEEVAVSTTDGVDYRI
ncbi:hypothetical protein AXX12_03945 [Anaerosporomusa subterranea]|uniref:Flagellar hook-length control protein-like C-terminal domain-containing protein n=1 Tax=Anaerosporomusa subterranea TaxID=1794912 RepID=A0A154BTZ7_ANASB|nr:flagellar hook-length control protein FliK [Anaerosporomusa subterranea]KYZ77290.1 hypothetical protein AXX12_03945 [Anaerosporomusa subterranea]